jgi:hypothetical protein
MLHNSKSGSRFAYVGLGNCLAYIAFAICDLSGGMKNFFWSKLDSHKPSDFCWPKQVYDGALLDIVKDSHEAKGSVHCLCRFDRLCA